MNIDLSDEEAAALLRELDDIIASDRYFLSPRITTLKAIRGKDRATIRGTRRLKPSPWAVGIFAPSRATPSGQAAGWLEFLTLGAGRP
jgi:hypothetical protein